MYVPNNSRIDSYNKSITIYPATKNPIARYGAAVLNTDDWRHITAIILQAGGGIVSLCLTGAFGYNISAYGWSPWCLLIVLPAIWAIVAGIHVALVGNDFYDLLVKHQIASSVKIILTEVEDIQNLKVGVKLPSATIKTTLDLAREYNALDNIGNRAAQARMNEIEEMLQTLAESLGQAHNKAKELQRERTAATLSKTRVKEVQAGELLAAVKAIPENITIDAK